MYQEEKELNDPARAFVKNTLKPILCCFENHFKSCITAFVEKHGKLSCATFKKKVCKGLVNESGLCSI
jgi:hypothetical protein